jgi:sRNA-binding protein
VPAVEPIVTFLCLDLVVLSARRSRTVLPVATLHVSRQPTSPMTVIQPPPAPNPPTVAVPIPLDHKSEAHRAYREARTAITLLQQRWPAAFPQAPQQVRPLIAGLTPLIAAALDWSRPYTRAVLRTWKLRPAYCRAVLDHPVRFDLDGNPTDQPIEEDARTQAKVRLAAWASKRRRSAPHQPRGGGTTASSPTQPPDHRKPADTATAPASSRCRSKSPKGHSAAGSTSSSRP